MVEIWMGGQLQPKSPEAIKNKILHFSSLDVTSIRAAWRTAFKREGKGIPAGILLRMLTWQIQERALGGYDRATERALDRYATPYGSLDSAGRHVAAGTVLVREYRGHRHTVTAASEGFIWRDQTYSNLSKIANAITGVKWNGPRFFGLRQLKGEKKPRAGARA